ncbi:DUF2194 domain-containing protein [Aureibaculum luteum]|uniref:DUF2194 domain-containing protein n=1 Tax=Aureibaculum luteum TaxID=1548456 RepID=UPI000E494A83|nr:DUF2194 domain-containing protein [Aureibaculum luteum]
MIVVGNKFINKYNQNPDSTSSIISNADLKNIILIELVTDSNDSISIDFGRHLKKIGDYSKFPVKEIDINEWNSPSYTIGETTKVIVVQNTLKLKGNTLEKLLTFVSQGGVLFVPNFIEDERMAYFYGLVKNGTRQKVDMPVGYYFDTNFLPNVKGTSYGEHIYHGGLDKFSFKDDVTILASAKNDRNYPAIIENNIGIGKVILFNTYEVLRKQDRGLLHSALLKGLENIPYPIANVSTIFLDDFPSPLYNTKEEPIKSEMDLTVLDFVKNVWWPDMKKLSDTFNIKYTALTAFDYRNSIKPPFLFDQWDNHLIIENERKISVTDWIAKDIIKHGHDLGLHGYNHTSLQVETWKEPDYMRIALASAKKKWTISGIGDFPVSYVPPSNYIDSIGMSELGKAFPSIKYMCSLYLGDYNEGGNREFDEEKWNPNFFDYPRISSGYDLNEEHKFVQQSLYIYSGIWTHFVHPDDVYQIPGGDESSAGHFSLRNKHSLGWHKSKDGKPGLLGVFANYLHEMEDIFPLSRYVSAEEGAKITKDWRKSQYSFSKNESEYFVERIDNDKKGEYYWFLYSSHKNVKKIEAELLQKTEKFEKTPFLDGFLYSIKTTHPSLSINSGSLNTMLTNTVARKVIDDYRLYKDHNYKITNLLSTYVKSEPSENASVQEWTKHYVATENLDKASLLLKEKIDTEKRLDTSAFNEYYKYMAWQNKSKEAWLTLQNHIEEYPLTENIKYSRSLGLKNGYPNEIIRKQFLEKQIKSFNDKEILREYYRTFNTPENKKEVTEVLIKLREVDPSLENEKFYLKHLIVYEPKQAIAELNKYIPSESSSLWNMSEEISWLYANNKRYKKAYDWSKYTQKITVVNKLYWLSEIKDFKTIRKEYIHFIANNPNDLKTKGEISKILLTNNQQIESWGIVSALPETIQKDTLKRALNEQVIYLNKITQKDLINRYANLFEVNVKKQIEKDIRLSENNSIEAETEIIGDNNSSTSFEKKITYTIKTEKLNSHSISVTNNDLYDVEKTSFSDIDNVNKNVTGLEYKFSNKPTGKINYWVRGRVEKDKQDNIYYQAGVGASLPKEKSFTSLSANIYPVKTGPGYQKKIYQSRLAIYQENNVKNVLKTIVYAEGNHYSNSDLEGSITTRVVLDNNKDKMFKVLPQVEASYSKSNKEETKDYPYYLVDKRFFAGGGVGLKYGTEKSKLNIRVEGSTFIDNDLGDFNRFTGQGSLKIGNFTKISATVELSTQSQAYSNSFKLGLKHTF